MRTIIVRVCGDYPRITIRVAGLFCGAGGSSTGGLTGVIRPVEAM